MIDVQRSSWPVDMATLRRSYAAVCLALAALVMCPKPVGAEEGDDPAKPVATDRQGAWSFFAAPYGWLEGASGAVVTGEGSLFHRAVRQRCSERVLHLA